MRVLAAVLAMAFLAGCGQAAVALPPPPPAPTAAPAVPPTQTPYAIVVTATPAPAPTVAPLATLFPPASQAQIQVMLGLVNQVAVACGMSPDATANTVLGAERVLAQAGVAYGSAPDVDAYLRDVLGQVQHAHTPCNIAFGSALDHVMAQHGLETPNGSGSYVPVKAAPPTPTVVDAPAE